MFIDKKRGLRVFGKIFVVVALFCLLLNVYVEARSLFDVEIEILPEYEIAVLGDSVRGKVSLFNLGKTNVDVDLDYWIEFLEGGEKISQRRKSFNVQTETSFVLDVPIPSDLEEGEYVFYAVAKYDDFYGVSSDSFLVSSEVPALSPDLNSLIGNGIVWTIVVFIGILLFVVITMLRNEFKGHRYDKSARSVVMELAEQDRNFGHGRILNRLRSFNV